MKKNRRRRTKPKPQQQRTAPSTQLSPVQTAAHRKMWSALRWVLAVSLAVLGLVASLDQLWGPFWPTFPIVRQAGDDPGSPFSLPFTATNRSVLFPLVGASMTCVIEHAEMRGDNVFANVRSGRRAPSTIPADSTVNFSCSIAAPKDFVSSATMLIQMEFSWTLLGFRFPVHWESGKFIWMKTTVGGV